MLTHSDLHAKTALITGAARRLGADIAATLADAGVNVVLHYRRSEVEARARQAALLQAGVNAWTLQADLSLPGAGAQLFARAVDAAGPIDFLINNASEFPESTLGEFTAQDLSRNMQVHLMAPVELGRAMFGQARPGVIVNLLDTRVNDYDRQHVAYHLSKRALDAATRMMALDYAPLLRVNAIAPGLILPPEGKDEAYLTALAHTNPLQAHGGSSDICAALLFLLQSNFITGQTIFIDGGRHLRGSVYGY